MPIFYAVLGTFFLALHLLAWNVTTAAPVVCIWLHVRAGRGDVAADRVGRRLARAAMGTLLVGIVLGGLLLALLWLSGNRSYFDAVARFQGRTWIFALGELLFSAICLIVYVAMWDRWRGRPWRHGLFAVLSATNLLYHFPPLMAVLGHLATQADFALPTLITRDVFRGLMLRPDVIALTAHFGLASLAVAGGVLMVLANRCRATEPTADEEQDPADTLIAGGAWVALVATLAQLLVGLWLLLILPAAARDGLIGDDWIATTMFFLAIVVSFALMHVLAAVALGDRSRSAVKRSAWLLGAIVLLMAGTLNRARQIESGDLGGAFQVVESPVEE